MKFLLFLLLFNCYIHESSTFPCVVNGGPFGGVKYPASNHHVTSFVQSIDIIFDAAVTVIGYTLNEVAATIEFTSGNNGHMIPQSAAINGNNITLYPEFITCLSGVNCGYRTINPQTIFFTSDEVNITATYRSLELLAGYINIGGIPLSNGQSLCTNWIDRLIPSITNIGIYKTVGLITTYQIMFNKPVSLCSGSTLKVLDFFTSMDSPVGSLAVYFSVNNILPVSSVPTRLWYFATVALLDDILQIKTIAPDKFCDTIGQGNVGYDRTTSFTTSVYQLSDSWVSTFAPFTRISRLLRNPHFMPEAPLLLDRDRNGFADAIILNLDGAVDMNSVTSSTVTFGTCTGVLSNLMSVQQVLPIGYNNSDSFVLKLNNIQVSFTIGTVSGCFSGTISPIQLKLSSSILPLLTTSSTFQIYAEYSALPPMILSAVYIPGLKRVIVTTNRIGNAVTISSFRFLTSLSSHATYYNITAISSSSLIYNLTLNDYIRGFVLNDSSNPLKAFLTLQTFVTDRIKPYWVGVSVIENSNRFASTSVVFRDSNFTEISVVFAATGLLIDSLNSSFLTLKCDAVIISYITVGLSELNTTLLLYVPLSACKNGLVMTMDILAHTIVNATAGNIDQKNITVQRIPLMIISSVIITSNQLLKLVTSGIGPIAVNSFDLVDAIEFYCNNTKIPLSFQLIEGNVAIFHLMFCDVNPLFMKKLYVPDNTFFDIVSPFVMMEHNNITIVPIVPTRFNPISTVIELYPYALVRITFGNVDDLNTTEIYPPYLEMFCDYILSTDTIIFNQQISHNTIELDITSCPILINTSFKFHQNYIYTNTSVSDAAELIPTIPDTFGILSSTLNMSNNLLVIQYLTSDIQQVTVSLFNLTCHNQQANLTLVSFTTSIVTLNVSNCSNPYNIFYIAEQAVLTTTEMSAQVFNTSITIILPPSSASSESDQSSSSSSGAESPGSSGEEFSSTGIGQDSSSTSPGQESSSTGIGQNSSSSTAYNGFSEKVSRTITILILLSMVIILGVAVTIIILSLLPNLVINKI